MEQTLQIELKQIQNRNQFFDKMLVESKKYLKDLTDFQAEYLCLYPNSIFELDLIEDGFPGILDKSFKYKKMFPIEDINKKYLYTSFVCVRNKGIKYNLAKGTENQTRFIIPNETIQFISIYNTEEELIKNVYLDQGYFNDTYEFHRSQSKKIKDGVLYSEGCLLYSNSQVYLYILENYDFN